MKVFEVKFECDNCGNVWTLEFEAGVRVREDWWGVLVIRDYDQRSVTRLCCPVCESKEDIRVRERRPLKRRTKE